MNLRIDAREGRLRDQAPAMHKLLKEIIEPGVFGYREPGDPFSPNTFLPPSFNETQAIRVRILCEEMGYGRVMQLAEALWHEKDPGHGHTVAAGGVVRKRIDNEIRDVLTKIDGDG